jgi:hypothetical protein
VTPTSIHPGLLEDAIQSTLKAWLPSHLERVARENAMPPRSLPQPRSWPVASEFDLEPHEQLPAIFIVSTGKAGTAQRETTGWRAIWSCEIAVAVAERDEASARRLAGLYLAAVRTALLWNDTLGGLADDIRWGTEDLAVGNVGRSARAVFGASFEINVPDSVSARPGEEPVIPPADPVPAPESGRVESVEITLEVEAQ